MKALAQQDRTRMLAVDAFRGLAATMVVIYHYTYRFDNIYGHSFDVPSWLYYGKFGVHLFFVISGFVIFMTISHARTATDFVISRFMRLYPAFWFGVILTFLVVLGFGLPGREVGLIDALFNLTMIPNMLGYPFVDGVYWSLQVELLFYFFVLMLYIFGQLKKIYRVLFIWLALSIIHPFMKIMAGDLQETLFLVKVIGYVFILKWAYLFSVGIIFYKSYIRGGLDTPDYLSLLLCVLSCSIYQNTRELIVIVVLCIGFFAYTRSFHRTPARALKVLAYLGFLSYPLYLVHQNIGYVVIRELSSYGLHVAVAVLIAFALSLILAHVVSELVEQPSLLAAKDLRRRFGGQRSPERV